jgi:hypothetical protein
VIVAVVVPTTALVVTVKIAVVAFAGTRTVAGTVAAATLLDSVTRVPPAGADPLRVTVAVELAVPPTTLAGFNTTDCTAVATGLTVNAATTEEPFVAVMFGVAVAATALVVTGKVAVVAPANTVTVGGVGTAATAGRLLERFTVNPPAGAATFNWTVAVDVVPAATVAGAKVSDAIHGVTVSVEVWVAAA